MQKIHVVYIITKLELGGAQKVCLTLFDGLAKAGIDTHLISGNQGFFVDQVHDKKNVILLGSLKREFSLGTLVHELRTFVHLIQTLRALQKEDPDLIVHTHSTKAGILGRWAAFFAGVRHRIHTIHGFAFHDHQSKVVWLLLYLPELLTSIITTHFICVSSADVTTGKKLLPSFSRKYSVIRAAVDWQQFTPAVRTDAGMLFSSDAYNAAQTDRHVFRHKPNSHNSTGDSPFIFGTVSCFKPQKNLFDLLNAFELVHEQNKNTRLELIGDGTQRTALESWIAQHNLSSAITLHGWQKKVAPIMRTWQTFVLSSLWEGLPCAIIEARLLGLPVICYNTGGIADVIIHEQNGLLCAKGDWHTLARHMRNIAQNPDLYMHLHTHRDHLDDYKDKHMIHEHAQLYKTVCTRAPKILHP
jgi:glycosyltransferase involved in cell wall biosynthesis